jgi:SpoVK/Ycf46/Vps4 family AAA+-type ATPase
MFTEEQVKELLQKQRESCAKAYNKQSQLPFVDEYDSIINAPPPDLSALLSVGEQPKKEQKD